MNSSVWMAVDIGGTLIGLTLGAFLLSLIPAPVRWNARQAVRWQWWALRDDVRSWWHFNGRHATGAHVHDQIECFDGSCAQGPMPADFIPLVVEKSKILGQGATEDWSPAAEVQEVIAEESMAEGIQVACTPLDVEALTILADLDALVESWRGVPKEYVDLAARVDESFAAAGMDVEAHHRWRATAFTISTAEWRLVPTG